MHKEIGMVMLTVITLLSLLMDQYGFLGVRMRLVHGENVIMKIDIE